MLGSMKGVKLLGMRDKAFEDLQGLRKEEIKKSEKYRELLIAAAVLGMSVPRPRQDRLKSGLTGDQATAMAPWRP